MQKRLILLQSKTHPLQYNPSLSWCIHLHLVVSLFEWDWYLVAVQPECVTPDWMWKELGPPVSWEWCHSATNILKNFRLNNVFQFCLRDLAQRNNHMLSPMMTCPSIVHLKRINVVKYCLSSDWFGCVAIWLVKKLGPFLLSENMTFFNLQTSKAPIIALVFRL